MSNKITPLIGISNCAIGILSYKFIVDLIAHINRNLYNMELIQQNIIYEFLFGIGLFTLVYMLIKNNCLYINEIKYGLYFCSIILIFESIFINWNHLTSDTKLVITGIAVLIIIGLTIVKSKN